MMIHPSYKELINRVNENEAEEGVPVVSSRYSIVMATAKRARQLISGAEPKVKVKSDGKALSAAVQELYEGKVNIMPENGTEMEE